MRHGHMCGDQCTMESKMAKEMRGAHRGGQGSAQVGPAGAKGFEFHAVCQIKPLQFSIIIVLSPHDLIYTV